jgi:hypothetical protein
MYTKVLKYIDTVENAYRSKSFSPNGDLPSQQKNKEKKKKTGQEIITCARD